jgi:hypothetical protein
MIKKPITLLITCLLFFFINGEKTCTNIWTQDNYNINSLYKISIQVCTEHIKNITIIDTPIFPELIIFNETINKTINKEINKTINKEINKTINKEINKTINKEINKTYYLPQLFKNIINTSSPIIVNNTNSSSSTIGNITNSSLKNHILNISHNNIIPNNLQKLKQNNLSNLTNNSSNITDIFQPSNHLNSNHLNSIHIILISIVSTIFLILLLVVIFMILKKHNKCKCCKNKICVDDQEISKTNSTNNKDPKGKKQNIKLNIDTTIKKIDVIHRINKLKKQNMNNTTIKKLKNPVIKKNKPPKHPPGINIQYLNHQGITQGSLNSNFPPPPPPPHNQKNSNQNMRSNIDIV